MNPILRIFLCITTVAQFMAPVDLKHLGVSPGMTTISGFSSGGAFAIQLYIVHSGNISGAAEFAGVPYLCGDKRLPTTTIRNECLKFPNLDQVDDYVKKAKVLALENEIDDLENLKNKPVFVYTGSADPISNPENAKIIRKFYEAFGANVRAVVDIPAGHGVPTKDFGRPCNESSSIFINNCNYNGAFDSLNFLYGESLIPPSDPTASKNFTLKEFNQTEFKSISGNTLDDSGFIFVPSNCENNEETLCRLHVHFHGCTLSRSYVGDSYIRGTGLLEVAEVNNIIIVFPQIKGKSDNRDCWDWYKYTGDKFATREGPQIRAVFEMINRVATL